jgi:hypothetical protein
MAKSLAMSPVAKVEYIDQCVINAELIIDPCLPIKPHLIVVFFELIIYLMIFSLSFDAPRYYLQFNAVPKEILNHFNEYSQVGVITRWLDRHALVLGSSRRKYKLAGPDVI